MRRMTTNELSGVALDWAVSVASGEYVPVAVPAYSSDWAHGGPIIEREGICVRYDPKDARGAWYAVQGRGRFLSPDHEGSGTTPLIAAMRCYVASKLGDEVQIPEALK